MFQYASGYHGQGLNYAYLPHMAYQLCYMPSEQMYFMPPPLLPPNYDLLTFNHAPVPQKDIESAQFQPSLSATTPAATLTQKTAIKKSNEEFNLQKNEEENKIEPKQKFGRNICSNIFHLMVKFIKKQKKMRTVVARIIQSNKLTIKVHQFYQIFKNRSYKLKAYANVSKISEFWRGPTFADAELNGKNVKEMECSKIFRILSRLYLTDHHLPYVYNSLKIKSESKRLHMDSIRKILSL